MSVFKDYVQKIAGVPGVPELIQYLKTTDYFRAPASSKFHSACPGGLVEHSVQVATNLVNLSDKLGVKWERPESPYIIGLFHDLCKVNFYKESTRNVKNEQTGKWETQPYYTIDDQLPLGHGAKSALILQQYIKLTTQELVCIVHHMGAFGDSNVQRDYSAVVNKYPEVLVVALADHSSGVAETIGPERSKEYGFLSYKAE